MLSRPSRSEDFDAGFTGCPPGLGRLPPVLAGLGLEHLGVKLAYLGVFCRSGHRRPLA